jgi:hypothetical protein
MSYLLHLPIKGSLLDHHEIMTRDKSVVMMTFLGAEPHVDERQIKETIGAYTKITYVRALFDRHVQSEAGYTKEGNPYEANKFQDFTNKELSRNTIFHRME